MGHGARGLLARTATAWDYFPHDHARSRAYRWGEDGLLGICDRECRLCFALALWNGRDPILKERLFGLTGPEGNHGEDVKECYYYLDSTPTHSYMKALYKYPQARVSLRAAASRRTAAAARHEPRVRARRHRRLRRATATSTSSPSTPRPSPDDILIRITVANRGPEAATLHVLPTLWFRNTWSWGCTHEGCGPKPRIDADGRRRASSREHATLGQLSASTSSRAGRHAPELLFTENETNAERLFGARTTAAAT